MRREVACTARQRVSVFQREFDEGEYKRYAKSKWGMRLLRNMEEVSEHSIA